MTTVGELIEMLLTRSAGDLDMEVWTEERDVPNRPLIQPQVREYDMSQLVPEKPVLLIYY
jgi:hypothetical protein